VKGDVVYADAPCGADEDFVNAPRTVVQQVSSCQVHAEFHKRTNSGTTNRRAWTPTNGEPDAQGADDRACDVP